MEKWLVLAMFAQVLLTFVVMVIMGKRRIAAAKNKEIQFDDFKTMSLEHAKESVVIAGRSYLNQFEMPILFYVVCITALVMNLTGWLFAAFAWAYVLLRITHCVIHLTSNTLKLRYYSFIVSSLVLLLMWLILVIRVF